MMPLDGGASPTPSSKYQTPLIGFALVVRSSTGADFALRWPSLPANEKESETVASLRELWSIPTSALVRLLMPAAAKRASSKLDVCVDTVRLVGRVFSLTGGSTAAFVFALDAQCDAIIEQARVKLRTNPTKTAFGREFPGSLAAVRPLRRAARDMAWILENTEREDGYVTRELAKLRDLASSGELTQEPNTTNRLLGSLSIKPLGSNKKPASQASGLVARSSTPSVFFSRTKFSPQVPMRSMLQKASSASAEILLSPPHSGTPMLPSCTPVPHSASSEVSSNNNNNNNNEVPVMSPTSIEKQTSAASYESLVSYSTSFLDIALKRSTLAQELVRVHRSLIDTGTCEAKFRGGKTVSKLTLLSDPANRPLDPIRPYHSIILTETQSHDWEHDSLIARELISAYQEGSVCKEGLTSLEEASLLLDSSFEQISKIVASLRAWNLVRVVHAFTDLGMFSVSKSCDLAGLSAANQYDIKGVALNPTTRFAESFPNVSAGLAAVLASIGEPNPHTMHPKRFSDLKSDTTWGQNSESLVSRVLVWLLRGDWIVEVFQHVYFVPPYVAPRSVNVTPWASPTASLTRAASTGPMPSGSPTSVSGMEFKTPSPLSSRSTSAVSLPPVFPSTEAAPHSSPAPQGSPASSTSEKTFLRLEALSSCLSPSQMNYMRNAYESENPVFRLLFRLAPVLAEKRHVEEICFRAGITRAALDMLLQFYSDALCVALHEG